MKAIISFLIFTSLNLSEPSTPKQTIPVKERMFLTMERTPCFGKCPSYKIIIFNTGNVSYEGFSFATKEGKHTKKITQEQLSEIQLKMEEIKFFELNDRYDSRVTDIPSTRLYVEYKGQKKKLLDRVGAPKELKEFEKLIDSIIIDDKLVKVAE